MYHYVMVLKMLYDDTRHLKCCLIYNNIHTTGTLKKIQQSDGTSKGDINCHLYHIVYTDMMPYGAATACYQSYA